MARLTQTDPAPQRSLVLDYVTLNSGQTNWVFQGDTTYFVSGECNLRGTTTIEGGAVIKANNNGRIDIDQNGAIVCNTGPYRPAVFTSFNDNTVGDAISGSSGSPALYDVNQFLNINATNAGVHDLRLAYCNLAMNQGGAPALLNIWNCQFRNNATALNGYNIELFNVLIASAATFYPTVNFAGPSLVAENVTAGYASGGSYGNCFVYPEGPSATVALTNCLITGEPIFTYGSATLLTNATICLLSPAAPVYQTVGAGSFYLTNGSPYRSAGVTNIDPWLLADLAARTTYTPIVYSNQTFSVDTNFSPQAPRDNSGSAVALGYHYDPLDYCFGGVKATANLTFAAGTAVGWFELPGSGGPGYGIALSNDLAATFTGTAAAPCVFARYDTVQEGGDGLWRDKGWLAGIQNGGTYDPANPGRLVVGFTRIFGLAGGPSNYRDGASGQPLQIVAINSEITGHSGGYNMYRAFTNCLFYRAGIGEATSDSQYAWETYRDIFRNCTFYGGHLNLTHSESPPYWRVTVRDCSFDAGTAFNISPPYTNGVADWAWLDDGYNAYLTNAATLPGPVGADVIVTNFNWQPSWFGNFYVPTNSPLVNAGDRTSDNIGLSEFTSQTNQTKEAISPVDIGYHYVATDQYGNPASTLVSGVPDYISDADGDGLPDWWEWNYFGNYSRTGTSLDMYFRSLLYDYQNGVNPNSMGVSQVLAWGDNSFGQCNVPLNLSNAVAVAGNSDAYFALTEYILHTNGEIIISWQWTNIQNEAYSLALRTDGRMVAWGDNSYGQTNIPSNLTNIVAISAGSCHGLALDSNGKVHTWGNWDSTNQYNIDSVLHSAFAPSGISNVIAIAAGRNHDVALRSNGTVLSWGYNTNAAWVVVPTNLPPAKEVAAGWNYSAALLTNGTIVIWAGDLSAPTNSIAWPIPASLTNAVSISGGPLDILALKADGDIIDLTADGEIDVSQITNAVSVADGYTPGLALDSGGTVWILANSIPSPDYPLSNIIAIAAGWNHAIAIRGGLLPPFIVSQPVSQIVGPGTNFTLSVQALSYVNPSYQWQFNGTNLPGATNALLTLSNVQSSNSGYYCCVVANNFGQAFSSNALVNIVTPPVILSQTPQQTNLTFGVTYQTNVTLSVMAAAPGMTNGFPLSYQWRANGVNIQGATVASYNVDAVAPITNQYAVVVSNIAGSVTGFVWQVTAHYAINVTNDLLLVYNTTSADSATVLNYYLAHRLMVGGANVVGIACTNSEIVDSVTFSNQILAPYLNWLTNNPAKHPQYVVLFLDIPSRVEDGTNVHAGVQYQLYSKTPGGQPFLTSINMNGTNDCIAYINKLASFGTNGQLTISASAGGYTNTTYVVDNARHGAGYADEVVANFGSVVSNAISGLITNGVSTNALIYNDGLSTITAILTNGVTNFVYYYAPQVMAATNLAGYICWGEHSALGEQYATNGAVKWAGNSSWWIIETIESFNGEVVQRSPQGNFIQWFSKNAFGGVNYSNTPVGAVSYVDEPALDGVNNSFIYFGLWSTGKNLAICGWESSQVSGAYPPELQVVGDPFVIK